MVVTPLAPARVVKVNLGLARALGADDLWMGDHVRHVLPKSLWQTSPMARFIPDIDGWLDPTAVIARYCRRHGPRMGTYVTDPIRRSPSDLARAWLSLHHLTGGNVILGIGAGEAMNIEPVGESVSRAVTRLEDTLSAIRAAWSANGGYVTHEGPFHRWRDAAFPPPYKGTVPPVWVAAHGPKACGVAARWGDGWISLAQTLEDWKVGAATVATQAVAAGRDPAVMEWNVCGVILPSPNYAAHKKLCSAPLIKAVALALPASTWRTIGASHPFGDTGGPSTHHGSDGELLEGDRFREAARVVTPDLCEALFPSGPGHKMAERLSVFVEHGVSHIVTMNLAPAVSFGIGVQSLQQQQRLNYRLKKLVPGSRSWATAADRGQAALRDCEAVSRLRPPASTGPTMSVAAE